MSYDYFDFVKQQITKAYMVSGKPIPQIIDTITEEVITKIPKKVQRPEIEMLFHKGSYGEYGEYQWLSPLLFKKWIDAYMCSPERKLFVERTRPKLVALPVEKSPELILEENIEVFKLAIVDMKIKGSYNDYGGYFYKLIFHNLTTDNPDLQLKDLSEFEEMARCNTFEGGTRSIKAVMSEMQYNTKQLCFNEWLRRFTNLGYCAADLASMLRFPLIFPEHETKKTQ